MISAHLEENKNTKRWQILRVRIVEENIKKAFRIFRGHEIEPILIKGWAAAIEYPEKYQRPFADIDLCVAPELYEKALKMIGDTEAVSLGIDLHCGLRHLDTVGWSDLFEDSRMKLIDDVPVRILSREAHLRVLCVHWLTDGGSHKKRLQDIFYILENSSEKFDWEKCFAPVTKRRREWIIKTVAVVHKHYPLDVSRIPFAEQLNSIPRWFSEALEKEWASGRRLQPLLSSMSSGEEFWEQLKKRFPPNAIEATVEMEGDFDDSSRIYYQIGSVFLRIKPSVKRAFGVLKKRIFG